MNCSVFSGSAWPVDLRVCGQVERNINKAEERYRRTIATRLSVSGAAVSERCLRRPNGSVVESIHTEAFLLGFNSTEVFISSYGQGRTRCWVGTHVPMSCVRLVSFNTAMDYQFFRYSVVETSIS